MPYDGKLLARARARLEYIRSENQAEARRRTDTVYARVPEIESLERLMRSQMSELVRITVSHCPDAKERIDRLKHENLDAQMRRAELLTENGFPIDWLDGVHSCPKCGDTGVYDNGVCSCLDKLYNMELTKELGTLLQSGDESFEHFDLSLYSAELDPDYGFSPRHCMTASFETCKRFAEKFPELSSNLLLQGGTGLGKTYLSACTARVIAGKGYSVCYDSAFAALEAFEKQKFSRDAQESEAAAVRVRRMLDCDLMILDDLGTEMITPMSISALYTLINTRLVNAKRMIISTNCSDEELQKKYTPQIFSRISGEFYKVPFIGKDIRLIRKG